MTDKDWITEGAHVAEYQSRNFGPAGVTIARIERLTATQIVLDNGTRYRRDTLYRVGDHYRQRLRPARDPDVIGAQQARVVGSLRHSIDRLFRAGEASNGGAAVARLVEIEQLVADARQQVEKLADITGKEQRA